MRIILILISLAFTLSGVYAQTAHVERIDVAEYGIYAAAVDRSQRDAKGVLQSSLSDIRHVDTTRNIPAQLGVRFGFRFTVVGTPETGQVKLRKVVVYPGTLKPNSGQPISRSETTIMAGVGKTQYTDYGFDDPWELATGVWTVELWDGDRKLVSESFTVVKPTAGQSEEKRG